jgi:phosphomannomutase
VSNLSSTRALRDVTRSYGQTYSAAAVGEVNVVTKMKEVGAVIGGEGNGGVIYPAIHYGRDALVGIALFLSHLAHEGKKASELRASYPPYFIAKNRVDLTPEINVDAILTKVKEIYKDEEINDIDGVKIDFADKWVHLRKSNTEPIIRGDRTEDHERDSRSGEIRTNDMNMRKADATAPAFLFFIFLGLFSLSR